MTTLNWCLKPKPKKCHFFQCNIVFLEYVLSTDNICANSKKVDKVNANSKKVDKVKNWLLPTNPKELQSFWCWPHNIASSYLSLLPSLNVCTSWLVQLIIKKAKESKKDEPMAIQGKQLSHGQVNTKSHLTSSNST